MPCLIDWTHFYNWISESARKYLNEFVPFIQVNNQEDVDTACTFARNCLKSANDANLSPVQIEVIVGFVAAIYNSRKAAEARCASMAKTQMPTEQESKTAFTVYEGLPKYHSERLDKVKEIFEMIEEPETRRVLITAPLQSGKSSLADLVVRHGRRNMKQVFAISFAGLHNRDCDGIDTYFQILKGMSLIQFLAKVVANSSYIVVLDECQKIFHVDEFWNLFKFMPGKGCCALLAFALPAKKTENAFAPLMFQCQVPLSYKFVWFNEAELLEVICKVASACDKFDPNDAAFVEFMKTNVSSVDKSTNNRYTFYGAEANDRICYHPGLTYAILQLFMSDTWTKEKIQEAIACSSSICHLVCDDSPIARIFSEL